MSKNSEYGLRCTKELSNEEIDQLLSAINRGEDLAEQQIVIKDPEVKNAWAKFERFFNTLTDDVLATIAKEKKKTFKELQELWRETFNEERFSD
jgi:hypothetical protein